MTENDDAGLRERNTNLDSLTEVKAESDVCCTSSNAVKVIESVDSEEILFVPDQYLEYYNSPKTDKKMMYTAYYSQSRDCYFCHLRDGQVYLTQRKSVDGITPQANSEKRGKVSAYWNYLSSSFLLGRLSLI